MCRNATGTFAPEERLSLISTSASSSLFTIAFIFPTHFIGTFIKPSHADAFDMSLRPCSAIHPELTTFFLTNGSLWSRRQVAITP